MRVAWSGMQLEAKKQNSATKDLFVKLAGYVSKFMRSMTDDALLYHPYLGMISYQGLNKFPGAIALLNLNKELTWKENKDELRTAIWLTDFVYSQILS